MDFATELLGLIADADMCSSLWWKREGDGLAFFINCNDTFWWACADCERVTPDNLHVLRQAIADSEDNGDTLFCARVRGIRPQGAWYSYCKREEWPLFHACGPEREVQFGNPCRPGEYASGQYSDKNIAPNAI